MQTMGKVHYLQTFSRGLWEIKSSSETYLLDFLTIRNKMAISKFWSGYLDKKWASEGAYLPYIFFT